MRRLIQRPLVLNARLRALTQPLDEGHEFLVLAQRQDGALVWSYGRREAEELQEGGTIHIKDLVKGIGRRPI